MTVKDNDLVDQVKEIPLEIQTNLFAKAKKSLEESVVTVTSYEDFKKTAESRGGFIRACWCGSAECEETHPNRHWRNHTNAST